MQSIYVKTYFPKQRSVALTAAVALILTLLYLLSGSTQASGATVGTGVCTQTVGSSTGVSVAVVGNNCVITFTNVGTTTWTVPAGVGSVRSLVVGGGGGAGGGGCNWMYPRGGGGGAVVDAATNVIAGSTVPIIVGGGGSAPVNTHGCDGPPGVTTVGGTGGTSQFASLSPVLGGSSSPTLTSAGGTSGNGYLGSGAAGAGDTMVSWSGGGGGGAGGPGTQNISGSNWTSTGGLFGNGGPGLFSDITGVSVGHGGGGSGYGVAGPGSASSGGQYGSAGLNYGGSYGGGGRDGTGGPGVVIISYDPTCPLDSGYTNCQLFSYTGSNQSFTFPANINGTQEILVEVWGAGGGGTAVYYAFDNGGAAGGFSKARISGTANEVLTVIVGQGGLTQDTTVQYAGGGPGGTGAKSGSSGGGYSGVFSGSGTSTPLIISGGGGGSSPGTEYVGIDSPGGGGGANQNGGQGAGTQTSQNATSAQMAGRGGTLSTGGAGATGNVSCVTTGSVSINGSSLLGGSGCGQASAEGGGGGGGGYFGGGGGAFQVTTSPNGGGGGGSGYINSARATTITSVAGGNGVRGFAYPDVTSSRYANNVGRGGDRNTDTLANNSGGNGYITIQWKTSSWISSVPNAPTIGTATATGGTTATVAFTAPTSNGGATINSYTATSSPAGGTGTLSQAGSGTISVTGLEPGVDYTFTIIATNSVGTSSPSAASNSIATTQPTATGSQLPTVLTVDPQSSSRFLPMTLNTTGPTNLLFCLNETDSSGNNLGSPTINFDVAANGSTTTAGTGTSYIVGDRSTAAYIYGNGANVISTLNSVSGTQIYLTSGNFNSTTGASKYIRVRAISIAASSGIGSKTCSSTPYTSQIIEIRPLGLTRIMKKGTITLRN